MDILLDTTVIVDHLRGSEAVLRAFEKLMEKDSRFFSCDITIAETFSGMRIHEASHTELFLNSLTYLPTEYLVAQKAGEMKSMFSRVGKTVTLSDALIAALAIEHDLVVMTLNRKHFVIFEGLRLYDVAP